MNRKRWIRILKMLHGIGITALALLIFLGTASAATLCVDKTGVGAAECTTTYTTIQAAVNSSIDGDTIKVGPGNYIEGTGVTINKSINIIGIAGPENTMVDGSTNGFNVSTNNTQVTISGLNIVGNVDGVKAWKTTLVLKNNIIAGRTGKGVYCASTTCTDNTYCNILNNNILSSGQDGIYTEDINPGCCSCSATTTVNMYNNIITDSINLTSDSESCANNTITGSITSASCTNTQTADPLFIPGHYCAVQTGSPTIDAGSPSTIDNDPDGTRNNQGACGGPFAAAFWPYPSGGPVITNLTVTPASVPQGGTITIQATGEVR